MEENILDKYEVELEKLQRILLDNLDTIDPNDEYDWNDLILGFLMALDIPQIDALELISLLED